MRSDTCKGVETGGQGPFSDGPCQPVSDTDIDGVRQLYKAVIQRALHDACGCTIVSPTPAHQLRDALAAWNFLYSPKPEYLNERWLVCELAGVDPEVVEYRMKIAAIPRPTYDTMKRAWSELELAYWRLGGQNGPAPEARPERINHHGKERGRRVRKNKSYVPRHRRGHEYGRDPIVPRDRRSRQPQHALLFTPRPQGTPVYPSGNFTSRTNGATESVRRIGNSQLGLPFTF